MRHVLWIVAGWLALLFLLAGALEWVPYNGSPQHSSRQEARDHVERHDESAVRGCCAEFSQ